MYATMSLKEQVKERVRELSRYLGIEVRRNGVNVRPDLRFQRFLQGHSIQTIVDVGASRGQFAIETLARGFTGEIVSFEALPGVHLELQEHAKQFKDRWTVAPRTALGREHGVTAFHVTRNRQSSSLLVPSSDLQRMSANLEQTEVIEVPCTTLDRFFPNTDELGRFVLKLDVQGAEMSVLEGGLNTLSACSGVLIELSLVPLYEGQPLASDLDSFLRSEGFSAWDIIPFYRAPESGRLLQYDAIYFRE
ncbi:MAG: FkbM family methyltransferase [Myxococcota bacterium]